MALADSKGNIIAHTPTDEEVEQYFNEKHIKEQRERVSTPTGREREEKEILSHLLENMEKENNFHESCNPLRIFSAKMDKGLFLVHVNRIIGELTSSDRDAIENHTLLTPIKMERTKGGSLITYGLAADIETQIK